MSEPVKVVTSVQLRYETTKGPAFVDCAYDTEFAVWGVGVNLGEHGYLDHEIAIHALAKRARSFADAVLGPVTVEAPGPCGVCGAVCRNDEHPANRYFNRWQRARRWAARWKLSAKRHGWSSTRADGTTRVTHTCGDWKLNPALRWVCGSCAKDAPEVQPGCGDPIRVACPSCGVPGFTRAELPLHRCHAVERGTYGHPDTPWCTGIDCAGECGRELGQLKASDPLPRTPLCPVPNCHAGFLRGTSGRDEISCPVCDGTLTREEYVASHGAAHTPPPGAFGLPEVARTLVPERASTLFDAIAHGDGEHRSWLREAIEAHFAGKPVPPARSVWETVAEWSSWDGTQSYRKQAKTP